MLVPITIASSFFMEGLDSTVITTCLPQIASAFGIHVAVISSAITTYLVSIAVFIPLSGWLADRFEIRRVYCAAIAVFAIGSVLCGLSTSPSLLVFGRFTQGLGGALMTPVGRLILVRSFPKDQLVHAMSFMIIPGLVGPMLGPVVGGFIATYADWRWIFFINVPLAALAIVLALSFIDRFESPLPGPFDFRGFLLAGATFSCLQSALGLLSAADNLARAGALFVAAAAFGLLYGVHAHRRQHAVIDLAMFRRRLFRIAIFAGALARIGIAVPAFLVPILLQVAFGYSAFHAGVLMFALAAGQIAMRFLIRAIYRRCSLRRVLLATGLLLVLALAGFASLTTGVRDAMLLVYLFGIGLLQSVMLSTIAALCFSDIPPEAAGQATTISSVSQRFSLAVGVSLSAFALQMARPDGHLTGHDFVAPFVAMAALQSLCLFGFRAMHEGDGADLAARR
jgi:EmrB/QacA subfamily drug resistance transporter